MITSFGDVSLRFQSQGALPLRGQYINQSRHPFIFQVDVGLHSVCRRNILKCPLSISCQSVVSKMLASNSRLLLRNDNKKGRLDGEP